MRAGRHKSKSPRRKSPPSTQNLFGGGKGDSAMTNNSNESNASNNTKRQQQQQQNQPSPSDDNIRPIWLPLHWKHESVSRRLNNSGKTRDNYYYSPKCSLRFRSKPEVQKFLHFLGTVHDGDEMAAYELFKESLAVRRCRGMGDDGGGGGRTMSPRASRNEQEEVALFPRSSRKNRSVPRRRYGDMDWQSPSSSCASEGEAGMMLPDAAASSSNRDKPANFIDSSSYLATKKSSYLATKNQEVHKIGDVGYTFRKKFHAGWFTGTVTKIRPGAQFDKDRRCIYEDGDEEDLSLEDLKILAALEKLDDRQQRMKDPSDKIDRIQKKKRVSLKVDNDDNNIPPDRLGHTPFNLPPPANGYEYTKKEAAEIVTRFPRKIPGECDGRQRAAVAKEIFDRGLVPISRRNFYKLIDKYEAGIPLHTEWGKSTRWNDGDLIGRNRNEGQIGRGGLASKEDLVGSSDVRILPRGEQTDKELDEYLREIQGDKWSIQFERLKEFKRRHGTTNLEGIGVDKHFKDWVKTMRYQCRCFARGETSDRHGKMNTRFALLQSIGFDFELRQEANIQFPSSTKSSKRKGVFVPDEVLSQGPTSTACRKKPCVSAEAIAAAKEPSLEDREVILLDSLNDVPLDKTAESLSHFQIDAAGDDIESDGDNNEHGEEKELLKRVASLLTADRSTKVQKRPPSGPLSRSTSSITSSYSPPPSCVNTFADEITSSQLKPYAIPTTQLVSTYRASSTGGNTLAKSSINFERNKREFINNMFYWICACGTVNKFSSQDCSSCKAVKDAESQRSVLLEKAEKAIEPEDVQLVQEAAQFISMVDRPAIPDKVIAYLLERKIPGVTFSAFCASPSCDLEDYFYWFCGSCTMKNSYKRATCTACLQSKSALADSSSLLAIAAEAAAKSKTIEEAISLIHEKERLAIPVVVLDGLITCIAMVGKGRNKRRCKAARCTGFDYCVSHCNPLQSSRAAPKDRREDDYASESSPSKAARGINKINENFPTFLTGIDDKIVNSLNWSVNSIEDSILCEENKPFPLGMKVRKFFIGHGFHDGRIVKTVLKQLVDKEAKEQRPVLVYRVIYNDGDQEDFLHHEIVSLRQVYDQSNISPEASSSVQIPPGTCFEVKTGSTVKVISHNTPNECRNPDEGGRLVVQFDDSSKEAEVDLLKFQLAVVRKVNSPTSSPFPGETSFNGLNAPFLEWPGQGRVTVHTQSKNHLSTSQVYDIGEGLTLSRQLYKPSNLDNSVSKFTNTSVINNPRDTRPGVSVRMWDPAGCFNHLSYDPYDATVCEICGIDNDHDQVVICDKCDCGFHTYCLRPVMVNIPKGDWLCPACSSRSNSVPFEEYRKDIKQREMMSFLGLPFQNASRFFQKYSDAIGLFKENSKNAIKQRAISLQISSKEVTFEVGNIKFIRSPESSDWRLPVPLLTIKEWTTSLSTLVAAMKYCGMDKYSPNLLYPSMGQAKEDMNNPDLDVDKIQPMSKRNMDIFKAFKHNTEHGVFPPIRVVYDDNLGFNVEALAPIQKYTLVGEYVGDVVTMDKSGTSNSDSLFLLLHTDDPQTSLIIDPTHSGNYSRFLSGINNRNLSSKRKANIRTRRFAMDGKLHVALFTSRDIEAGEILSYDYNAGNHGKCLEEWAKAGFYDTSNFF